VRKSSSEMLQNADRKLEQDMPLIRLNDIGLQEAHLVLSGYWQRQVGAICFDHAIS
jgi:hypothetical protein